MDLEEIESHVSIAASNRKLTYPSISLPPVITCRTGAPCFKDCYSNKAWRLYPNTRLAWIKNLRTYKEFPGRYFQCIVEWININRSSHFRFHSAGDIVDKKYFLGVVDVAKRVPDTKFLIFTKQFQILERIDIPIPRNLEIVYSMWPGLHKPANAKGFPFAWMQDGTETRMDMAKTTVCPGSCEECLDCFDLAITGRDVMFHKH